MPGTGRASRRQCRASASGDRSRQAASARRQPGPTRSHAPRRSVPPRQYEPERNRSWPNATRWSSSAAGRSAWRSRSSSGRAASRCALVERHLTPQRIPKGQNLTKRTLEHFYFWGCVDELRAARVMPPGYPIGGVTAYGNLMSDYWFAPRVPAQTRCGSILLPGQRTPAAVPAPRRCCAQRLAALLPNVHVPCSARRRSTIEQDDARRRASTVGRRRAGRTSETGPRGRLRGGLRRRALAGARAAWASTAAARTSTSAWCWPCFARKELHEGLKRFPEVHDLPGAASRSCRGTGSSSAAIDVGEGFFFHAPVPRDTTPDNFDFLGLLQRGGRLRVRRRSSTTSASGTCASLVASEYRQGRVFIAGDACHSTRRMAASA